MKVLVTGSTGQLGQELHKISTKFNFEWIFTDSTMFNLLKLNNIDNFLNKSKPDLIINCAAFTSVDKAEEDFYTANIINHKAVGVIAKWCENNNSKLLHISTDYVYEGNLAIKYKENDMTAPINNYGKSKLLGDIICQQNNPSSIILRTSWLYSSFGNNFVKKMISLMKNNKLIQVVDDQFGSPTYAFDLANFILNLIKKKKWKPGVYHYTNKGKTSWFDFANQIKLMCRYNITLERISSEKFSQKAKRPKYSLLDNSKIIDTYNITQINYIDSLRNCIKIIQNES